MVNSTEILKKVLRKGNYHLCFKIMPHVCIGLVIINTVSVIIDIYLGVFQFPLIRTGIAAIFLLGFFYFLKSPEETIISKLIYEITLAIGLPLTFSFFMFINYTEWYFYCTIFLGGLLYGLASGYFAVPIINFPLMFYSAYVLSLHLIKIKEPDNLQNSVGIFIVVWFGVLCTTAARIGFDIFYLLNLALQEQKLQLSSLQKLREAEEQKLTLEKEINKFKEIETVGKFAGGIAHDFNNMLTVITGQVMYLKRVAETEQEKEKIGIILQSVKRTSELIRKLLSFTQRHDANAQVYVLNDYLESIVELVRRTPQDIAIETECISESLIVAGDPNLLSTSLIDLILSAAQVSQGNTLKIFLGSVQEFNIGEKHAYSFEDFSTKAFASITIIFKSAEIIDKYINSESKIHTDIINMIKAHNGRFIRISDRLNGKLILLFPLVEQKKIPYRVDLIKNHQNLVFMIVDDDLLVLKSTEEILAGAGYRVFAYNSCRNALQFYEKEWKSIDMVIMDMRMPEMSGKEMLREMKKINADIKVLIMTGYSSEEDINDVFKYGALGLLDKPFTDDDLFHSIGIVLKKEHSNSIQSEPDKMQ